jgi:hypothetical protein
MKVSIKNLTITFMGQGEPLSQTAPKEFYSPLERELRKDLEAMTKARDNVSMQNDNLRERNHKLDAEVNQLLGAGNRQIKELDLIKTWVKGYDEGAWPDHNATPNGDVSREVLHMMRDVQADLDSRPLPSTGLRMGDTGWNAPAPTQPRAEADPLPTVQPAPETSHTQPAAPESAMTPGPTANIHAQPSNDPETDGILFDGIQHRSRTLSTDVFVAFLQGKAMQCTGTNCRNAVPFDKLSCGAEGCDAETKRSVVAMTDEYNRNVQYTTPEASRSVLPQLSEPVEPEFPPCKKKGCDEPRTSHSLYCRNHGAS